MFLFAYGFSVEHNEDDSVALRLMQGRSDAIGECSYTNTSNAEHLNRPRALCPTSLQYGSEVEVGTFYVKCGGVSGIPEVGLPALFVIVLLWNQNNQSIIVVIMEPHT